VTNEYYINVKNLNFDYLKGTRYQKVFDTLNDAKKLYDVDKDSCCTKLRYALEIIINEVITICKFQNVKKNNLNTNLRLLRDKLPASLRQYNGEDILTEMHNVRINGNRSTHYDDENDVDIDKATHTCWIAMKKICKWVSTFESKYEEYKEKLKREAEEAEAKKKAKKAERNQKIKTTFKTVGKAVAVVATIAIAVLTGRRINKF